MLKENRSSKTLEQVGRSLTTSLTEERGSLLPRINTKKSLVTSPEPPLMNQKRESAKESLPGILSKELLAGLSMQEKMIIDDLSKKIDEQRKEIDARTQNMMAVQRNFEGMSSMLKKEKDLGVENKKKVATLTDDNVRLAEENRILLRRVEDMIERVNKYEQQIEMGAKDKKKIIQSLDEHESLKSKLHEVQQILSQKKKEVGDLEIRNKALMSQIDKLKGSATGSEEEKMKNMNQIRDLKNDLIISQTENERLHNLIVEYKLRLSDVNRLKEEFETILTQNVEKEKENRELKKEVSNLRRELTTLKEQNKKLEDGNQNRDLQMKFVHEKEEALAQEITELRAFLDVANSELRRNKATIEHLQETLDNDAKKYGRHKEVLRRCDEILDSGDEIALMTMKEFESYKQELEEERGKNGGFEEQKRIIEKLKKDMENKNEMIDRYVADNKYETEKGLRLEARIKQLEEEVKRYFVHSEKLQTALDFKNNNDKARDVQFTDEIMNLRMKLDSNISNLGDINSKHRNIVQEKDTLNREVWQLKGDLAAKTREVETLRKKLQGIESEKETVTRLEAELEKLYDMQRTSQKQIDDLKLQNNEKNDEIRRLHGLIDYHEKHDEKNQIKILETQIKELKNSIDLKNRQIHSLKELNQELSSAGSENKKGLEEKMKMLQFWEEKAKSLEAKSESLTLQNQDMKTELSIVQNELKGIKEKLAQTEMALGALESKYHEAMEKLATLDESRFQKLEARESQFNQVIAKIDHAQSSLLISLSCCECMSPMKNPCTVLPCGHNYCEKCKPKGKYCKECGEKQVEMEHCFRNQILDDIIAKVSYNQVMLESLKPK